jgi:twitching motility protein PilT
MQSGKKHGMQTMNDALYQLYVSREVTQEECLRATSDPNEFMRMIGEVPMEEKEMGEIDAKKRTAMRR